jgi:perosamine synthetase
MENNYIPVNEPVFWGNEKKYLNECIDTTFVGSDGKFVKKFETDFGNYQGVKYCSAVSNGSAALELAIESLALQPGDEVILPSLAIISCVQPLIRRGLVPVFVDTNKDTWNIDENLIEDKINSKTKLIIVIHTYGLPVDMIKVNSIAKKNNLFILEDCAEVLGLEFNGKKCGNFSDISIFSFYPNKHITTGEGGMVCSNNLKLYEKVEYFKNLCFNKEKRFKHYDLGWNFRMSNIQAALGCAQLESIELHLTKKRQIGLWYNELFSNLTDKLKLPLPILNGNENIYWVYSLELISDKITAELFIKKLSNSGIGARPFFYPLHKQPVFKDYDFYDQKLLNTEHSAQYGFYIPSGLSLTFEQAKKVVEVITNLLK